MFTSKILDFIDSVEHKLPSKQAKVGFLKGRSHANTDLTMAELAAIQEYGDRKERIPPRPFFRNAISNKEEEWKDQIVKAAKSGMDSETLLRYISEIVKGDVTESIYTIRYPPLADATIAARRARGNLSTKPLIDTKEMSQAVDIAITDIEPDDEPPQNSK